MRDIWVDTDMGFDDLAALLMANDRVAGLSLVAGNVTLDRAVRAACAIREIFGCGRPIHVGAASPIATPLVTAAYVLGEHGMRGGERLPEPKGGPDSEDAVGALGAWLDAGNVDVLALGPLTNIARLVQARPDLVGRMRLTWMGGSASGGNHTAAAEFNAAVDPEAVDIVLRSGVELSMVGLDCCRQVRITPEVVDPLRAIRGEKAALLEALLEGYIAIGGGHPMAIYDPVASAALIDPASVTFRPARVEMELSGTHTRGMTVVEWREGRAAPNARVAVEAASARIRGLFLDGLLRAARS